MNKKYFKIMFILFSFFLCSFKVNAAECVFQTAISYSDADVLKECYENYNDALNFMNNYKSTEKEVAVIKRNNKIINAAYAIAKIDVINEEEIKAKGNDGLKYIYSSSLEARNSIQNSTRKENLAYIASTWGSDAAFIDYDNTYDTVRIKISGVDGWIKKSQAIIIPTSKFYSETFNYPGHSPKITCNSNGVALRKEANVTSDAISGASSIAGSKYKIYPSKTVVAGGYTWYYIENGVHKGYYANNGSWFSESTEFLNDTYYFANNGVLKHAVHKGANYYDVVIDVGSVPFQYKIKGKKENLLSENKRYFSFDGNYYYDTYEKMINDYRNGNYNSSINKDAPYYAYFMYLPSRSKTSYTSDQFNQLIINQNYTGFPINPKSYVNPATGAFVKSRIGLSMMYGIGPSLIDAQNTYGTNALIIYANAVRESASGTSEIAFYKNNLFGLGAYDGSAFSSAFTYNSIDEGVKSYARFIGYGSDYSDLTDYKYKGTHEGNKLSGKGVHYATDPYSGESTSAFAFRADAASGKVDEFSNTIGIKNNDKLVNIYAERDKNSRVIYQTKNYNNNKILTNMPFSVIDYKDGFYKVYTDVSLNSNREFDKTKYYDYNVSYGYIHEDDLYVRNNKPVITAENQTVEAKKDFTYKPTAEDFENGDISNKIEADVEVNTNIPASYKVTYSVSDNEKLKTYKTITVTVTSPNTEIIVEDIETPQFVNFDPLKGLYASDVIDGDITKDVVVSGSVNTDVIGEYELTYTVTNSSDVTTSVKRKVKVIENERPIINATNKTVHKGMASINYLENVSASDKEDGNLTSKITYTGEVDLTKTGTYTITYSVKDSVNQLTEKTITITVEDKVYIKKESIFHLENLTVVNKLFNIKGFLIIKGMSNTLDKDIKYDIIFSNQDTNEDTIMSLDRLKKNIPFSAPNDENFINTGAWFTKDLDLSTLNSGDYTVYIRARSGDFEAKTVLKNLFFNKNVVRKVEIDNIGYRFKTNYYNKSIPLELSVRKDGLISIINNPTSDNMFNQVYGIDFKDNKMSIKGTSHNVNGNYGLTQNVERELYLEDVETKEIVKKYDIGSISNGPYVISLKVSDGLSKTRAWYEKSIDLSSVKKGRYSIILRTKTGSINDYGELYDILFLQIGKSHIHDGRKYTIVRNNEFRYRIELIIE